VPTAVTVPLAERLLIWIGFPLLGAGVGWLAQLLAGLLTHFPWRPVRGSMRLVEALPDPWPLMILAAAGTLVGLALAVVTAYERLTVTVEDDTVRFARGGRIGSALEGPAPRQFARADIGAVFPDGKKLVLLTRDAAELAREPHDLRRGALRDAFTAHGYPWQDTPNGAASRP
jgi:hypothetical protein